MTQPLVWRPAAIRAREPRAPPSLPNRDTPATRCGCAIMLTSNKFLRWLPFLIAPAAITALGFLAFRSEVAAIAFTIFAVGVLVGTSTILFPRVSSFRPAAFAGFAVTAAAAGFLAWF